MHTEIAEPQTSVGDILHSYNYLGIPHFQRGVVWNDADMGALLESLYEDVPCGSLIFWETSNEEFGVGLNGSGFKYLVVDGQQRINAIYSLLVDCSSKDGRPWCINLARIPEFVTGGHQIHVNSRQSKMPLFCKVKDPHEPKKKKQTAYDFNFIPITDIFKGVDITFQKGKQGPECLIVMKEQNETSQEAFFEKLDAFTQRIREIFNRKMFVKILNEEDNGEGHSKVIQIYNRINSGGLRVQSEEKAYASMTAVYNQTYRELRNIFKAVHSETNGGQREFMTRMKEKQFGFKLIIQIAVLVFNAKYDRSPGTGAINFSNIHQEALEKEDDWNGLWKDVSRIVVSLKEILEYAGCDDFRYLPETTSLMPIVQLLIQKEVSEDQKVKLAGLVIKLFFADLTQKQIFTIVNQIKENKAEDHFDETLRNIEKGYERKNIIDFMKDRIHGQEQPEAKNNTDDESHQLLDLIRHWLEQRLRGAASPMDRYTLLLYWMLRHRQAKDFSYEYNVKPENKENIIKELREKLQQNQKTFKEEDEDGVTLCAAVNPEKEHIVIFSKIKQYYGDSGRGSHIINNIGNITYISDELNGKEYGKWDEPLNITNETVANLTAHFIDDKIKSRYENLKQKLDDDEDQNSTEEIKKTFEELCNERRELIISGFLQWIEEKSTSQNKTYGY